MNKIPDREECLKLLSEYGTPYHVIRHCMAVCRVAVSIGERLNEKGYNINIELLRAAAMLHLQVGGGITADNAAEFIEAGASHVVVTSYVFREGKIQWDNLERLVRAVGKEHIVLDLSCRKKDASYYIVTDRWQTFTRTQVNEEILYWLKESCSEFLVHGVDVEGKAAGVPEDLVRLLSKIEGFPITYAGGIGSLEELERFRKISGGRLDFTIGSALDLFGGAISYNVVKNMS